MARRLTVTFLGAVGTSGALALLLEACPAPQAQPVGQICTPGAYVFCRCESRQEGTKLCLEKGNAFAKCSCAEPGQPRPPLSPNGNAGFEGVDAAVVPSSGPPIDAACAGKLAVLASTDKEDPADQQAPLYLYGAAYGGEGAWTVARSTGPSLRGQPSGGLVGTTLVAVWQTRFSLVGWTKFEANQKTLAPPVSVGEITTSKAPSFVGSTATGRIYHTAGDDTIREGVYSAAGGWDDGNALVPPGDPPITGKNAPVAALVGSSYSLAYTGANKAVSVQTQSSGSWGGAVTIPDASTFADTSPVSTNLVGGTEDLLIVYTGGDFALHWTTRAAGVWGAPALVDTSALPSGNPSVAPMAKGRAMLVWKAVNGIGFFSVYDPAGTPRWSTPASILKDGPKLTIAPSVISGRCASEATVAYLDETGRVNLALYSGRKWGGPHVVPGMTNMTFAGVGEVP